MEEEIQKFKQASKVIKEEWRKEQKAGRQPKPEPKSVEKKGTLSLKQQWKIAKDNKDKFTKVDPNTGKLKWDLKKIRSIM